MSWTPNSINLKDNNTGNLVIEEISEMNVTLKNQAP